MFGSGRAVLQKKLVGDWMNHLYIIVYHRITNQINEPYEAKLEKNEEMKPSVSFFSLRHKTEIMDWRWINYCIIGADTWSIML